jgi:hypothetical protein
MIMYKVTKGGVYRREVFKRTLKSVYYVFTDNMMMQRSKIEARITARHRWFENEIDAEIYHSELTGA